MEPTHFNEVETAHDTVLPAQDITVIGRNFFDTDLLQCKFTACRSNSSVATHREEPQICAVPNQHTDSEGTPSATRCGDTMVRDCVEINQCVGCTRTRRWRGRPGPVEQ